MASSSNISTGSNAPRPQRRKSTPCSSANSARKLEVLDASSPAESGRRKLAVSSGPGQQEETDTADPNPSNPSLQEESEAGDNSESVEESKNTTAKIQAAPPLPEEPLPDDDGWEPIWDESAQAFYFYNRHSGASQWTNPRVPPATSPSPTAALPDGPPGVGDYSRISAADPPPSITPLPPAPRPHGGYDPSIHGDYDPTAPYAQPSTPPAPDPALLPPSDVDYSATGTFNRFTGKWQGAHSAHPETFSDENKARRQMSAFFDVDAAANSHDGRSLKAERSGKKLSRAEVKAFREKRKERKEEKRRAWLRD
ncbi:MAG: hypothetical protein M1829_003687 [Trizodia sp. TS-e1964]|nr:MAG: hypothetical protein M1829_003687 [Trizodia sp. TS-e1964]